MYSSECISDEKNILWNIFDLLLEEGLITEKERDAMKNMMNSESD